MGHLRTYLHALGFSSVLGWSSMLGLSSMLANAVWTSDAAAQELGNSLADIEIHGFVSQGFIYTTDNQFLAESENGSFEFAEVGLNFTKQLTDEFRFGAQLFTRDLGPIGNYKASFDWFYADYRFFNWLGVRVGRYKLPFGLYNETRDVDAARAPILLPQSNYSEADRENLLAPTGLEIYGFQPLGSVGGVSYRAYVGTSYFESATPDPDEQTSIPTIAGLRGSWFTPLDGLKASFSLARLRLDLDATLGFTEEQVQQLQAAAILSPEYSGTLSLKLPATVWTASLEYVAYELSLAAEYSRTNLDYETNEPGLDPILFEDTMGPPYPRQDVNYYVMASYRVADWFTPGAYYSVSRFYLDLPREQHRYREDLALFVRYDLNAHWLLKLEGHYMDGTAGLDPELNEVEGEAGLSTLKRKWGAFLLKTTGYF